MTTLSPSPIDALVGNRGFTESMIGYEPLTRAARVLLFRDLNDEIDRQAERWHAADLAVQDLGMDPDLGQVDVQHVAPANFHEGSHESLLNAPSTAFPNVSIMAYAAVPSAIQFGAGPDTFDLTLFVETMVITGPVPEGHETTHEKIVHRRIQRTTEAIAAVFRDDPLVLGTAVPNEDAQPRGGIGQQSWVRREKKGAGPRYMWQGSRLQYTFQRHAGLA